MYGCQAVVISCDPKRQYVADPAALEPPPGKLPAPTVLKMAAGDEGPEGEGYAWYACTTQGGRETRQLDAIGLALACEALGAVRRTPISTPDQNVQLDLAAKTDACPFALFAQGEILLNCIDKDGTNSGKATHSQSATHHLRWDSMRLLLIQALTSVW